MGWWKSCFSGQINENGTRTLYMRGVKPDWSQTSEDSSNATPTFPPNSVKTSKYTVLNFLPKNLFEQFRRAANFYFLCVAVIQMSIDSPVAAWTSILPLVTVVFITALKQGYEDYKRHLQDNKVNNAPAKRLSDKEQIQEVDIKSSSIRVGDIIRIEANQEFTCDILLLLSSDSSRTCDVNTVNLDGETNLKCPSDLKIGKVKDLIDYEGVITCQLPHPNLYDFKGKLEGQFNYYRGTQVIPLRTDNLLLRGSKLVNTEYIYGCVVYTGPDSKMALNLKLTSNKFSTVEKSMNYYLLAYFTVLFLEILTCSLLRFYTYDNKTISDWWYLGPTSEELSSGDIAQDVLSFLVIFNYIIPISLYVTLEGQKFLGVLFFVWDKNMRDGPDGEPATCNTSDLNEELGQIQYLFTDKTGTLTENCMRFRQFSCGGKKYKVDSGRVVEVKDETQETKDAGENYPDSVRSLLTALALCHTVQATHRSRVRVPQGSVRQTTKNGLVSKFRSNGRNKENGNRLRNNNQTEEDVADEDESYGDYVYQASSPDEKALVESCQRLGVVYCGDDFGKVTLLNRGKPQEWQVLQVLDFDSDRRRMSVIVRSPEGRILLICKGADSSILPNCVESSHTHVTSKHIDNFANAGLRTLTVAQREFSEKDFEKVQEKTLQAQQSVEDRDELLRVLYDDLERDMDLLGATGVEDQLQQGVEITLESLRIAGIKVWVLTGDKLETAVNISLSCGHFKKNMKELELTLANSAEEAIDKLQQASVLLEDKSDKLLRLTLDGQTAAFLLAERKAELSDICSVCYAVLCCRMAPKQKAEIVRMVKSSKFSPVCAAIGDGANDVAMIQEAQVGIGIMGSEGRQAVRCSDFGFSQFRFLRRALLVHGRWYYIRVSFLVNYSFYKNVVFITPQVFYAFFNGMSTQSLYESFALTFYNITFTSLPILIYGLFEQDLSDTKLLKYPHLYSNFAGNTNMSGPHCLKWGLLGLWHSAALFTGLYYTTLDDTSISYPGVQTPDLYLFGTTLVSGVVAVVNAKILLETSHHNIFVLVSMLITFFGYLIFMFVYCSFISDFFSNFGIYWTFQLMFTSPSLLLYMILLTVACLIPDVILKVVSMEWSNDRDIKKGSAYRPFYRPAVNWMRRARTKDSYSLSMTELVS